MYQLLSGKLIISNAELEANIDGESSHKLPELDVEKHQEVIKKRLGLASIHKIDEGCGTFGVVYKGCLEEGNIDRLCAIKVLTAKRNRPGDLSKFWVKAQQEVVFLSNLKHPHILRYMCYRTIRHEENRLPCYVLLQTEFLDHSLLKICQENNWKQLEWSVVRRVARHIGSALEYLHSLNVVHHDVKERNIMESAATGHFKLIDFGLSKWYPRPTRQCFIRSGAVGTDFYVSPEMVECTSTDAEFNPYLADSYAFGMTLVSLLLGKEIVDVTKGREGVYNLAHVFAKHFLANGDHPNIKHLRAIHQLLEPSFPKRRLFMDQFMDLINEELEDPGTGLSQHHGIAAKLCNGDSAECFEAIQNAMSSAQLDNDSPPSSQYY